MLNQKPVRVVRSSSPRANSPRTSSPRTRRVEKLHGLKEKVQRALAEQQQGPYSPQYNTDQSSRPVENSDTSSPTSSDVNYIVQSVKSRFESASNNSGKPQAFAQMDAVSSGRQSPRNTSAVISAAVFGDTSNVATQPQPRPAPKRLSMKETQSPRPQPVMNPTISALSPRPLAARTSPRATSLRESHLLSGEKPAPPSASSSSPPEAVIGVDKSDMEKRRAAFEPNKFTEAEANRKNAEKERLSKWTTLTSAFESGKFKSYTNSTAKPPMPIHDKPIQQNLPPSPPRNTRRPSSSIAVSSTSSNQASGFGSKGFPRQDAPAPPPLNPNAKFITPTSKSQLQTSSRRLPNSADGATSEGNRSSLSGGTTAPWYSAPPPPTPPQQKQQQRQVQANPPPPSSSNDEEILLLTPPSGEKTSEYGTNIRSPTRKEFAEKNHIFNSQMNNASSDMSSSKGVREQVEHRNKVMSQQEGGGRVSINNHQEGNNAGGASAADVAAVSVAVVAEYNRRLEETESCLREAEETSADLASRLEDALAREDELVRRLQKHPMTPPRSNSNASFSSPSDSKHQYSDLLEGYKAAAAAAREDAEAARRDAENSRLEAKRREEAVSRQEATIAGKVAGISKENEELKNELYRITQQLTESQQQNDQSSSTSVSQEKMNKKVSMLESTCKQLEEALEQERLNHKEYVMSTHKKFEKICQEKASADSKVRSLEVRLNEMNKQCEQLVHEKDAAVSSAEKNSSHKVEAEIRNAVLEARREAQSQQSSVTSQLEKLRLEAENEAAQAHEMLANETAALKATRRELDELLSESVKSSRQIAELTAKVKRLEEDVEFSDNRADEAEERMRSMRNNQMESSQVSMETPESVKEKPKKESRWGSAINSVASMRISNRNKANGGGGISGGGQVGTSAEKRQDNHWIRNSTNNDSSSIPPYQATKSPTRWQSSPNLEADRSRTGSDGFDQAPPSNDDLEITVVGNFTSPGQGSGGSDGRRLSFGGQRTTSASKLENFMQGSPNDRGSSCPRPITPEKQKPAVPQRKASMSLADFMKVLPAEKAAKKT